MLPELVRRAEIAGYASMAVTDHVGVGSMQRILAEAIADRDLVASFSSVKVLVGVELTHVPPAKVDMLAALAKDSGADIVVVHGETMVEPVSPGTNEAAVSSRHVDILSHPGFISANEVELARLNGVFLELSARKGHGLTNGHVARMAMAGGAAMLVGSDAHGPSDLLTSSQALQVALGSGLESSAARKVIEENPTILLGRLG